MCEIKRDNSAGQTKCKQNANKMPKQNALKLKLGAKIEL